MVKPRKISEIKSTLMNVAQTSHYEVMFGGFPSSLLTTFYQKGLDSNFIGRKLGLLCYSATLPGSSLATMNIEGNFTGVQQQYAHTRIFNNITLDFYCDSKYKVLKFRSILYGFIFVFAILIIIIDSHRSVWITALATGATLFLIKEIKLRKIMNNALSVTFFIIIILFLAHQLIIISLKTNLTDFTISRANDLIKIDEKYDNTAAWRIAQWKAQIPKFSAFQH